ncbi:MAG: hypothetical protein PVH84_06220 [Candidatus Aminicenantes bacterium]|jgi:hypothetical protein
MRSKEILLLILLVAAGIFLYYAYTDKFDWDIVWGDDFLFKLEEFQFEESHTIDPPFPRSIHVVNRHGDIKIRGTDEDRIVVNMKKTIRRRTEEEAREVATRLKMVTERTANDLVLTTNRGEFRKKRFHTSFAISVPKDADITVTNTYGAVEVSNAGSTNIHNSYGKVIITDVSGELRVKNKYDDVNIQRVSAECTIDSNNSSVDVTEVDGTVRVFHRYGDVNLKDISRDVIVDASNAEIVCRNVEGLADVQSTYRDIILTNVGAAKVQAKNCEIQMNEVKDYSVIGGNYCGVKLINILGDLKIDATNTSVYGKSILGSKITIDTTYRDVELEDFAGETTILHSNGKILLTPKPLTQTLVVRGKYSDINLYWPAGGTYPTEAENKGGDIEWNLPYELSFQKENSVSMIKAFMGETESPLISLHTTYGTIRIEENP